MLKPSTRGVLVFVFLLLFLSSESFAGTVLKLNYGEIDTRHISRLFSESVIVQNTNDSRENNYIIQFKTPITENKKINLIQNQMSILGYLPDDALVVRATSKRVIDIQKNKDIQAVVPYSSYFKLSRHFENLNIFSAESVEGILVKTFLTTDTPKVVSELEKMNLFVKEASGTFILVVARRSELLSMASLNGVEHIEPLPEFNTKQFNDESLDQNNEFVRWNAAGDYSDLTGNETGTIVMNFAPAWARGLTGRGQIASMADTGLDVGDVNKIHADFFNSIRSGYAMGLFGKSWEDPQGHGTHVAGSILGKGAQSGGKIIGGAYEARLVAEGLWSPMLNNLSIPTKLTDLFVKAYADGARVHSNSWGSVKGLGAYDGFAAIVDDYMFNNQDMLILFAAGNSGVDSDKDGRIDSNSVSSPGTAKNVMTVGASENVTKTGGIQVPIGNLRSGKDNWGAEPIFSSYMSDNANGLAMFSSRGPTNDGRIKPDIVAPGTNILSTRSQQKDAGALWGAYNQYYAWAGGTSMATPLTAGAATVIRQYLIEELKINQPSSALIKALMMHTAVDIYPGQYGMGVHGQEILTPRPNADEGYGRVNVGSATSLDSRTTLIDEKMGVSQNEEKVYTISIGSKSRSSLNRGGEKLLVNLVWTDAPASTNASTSLVNDLDLVLENNGRVIYSSQDHINNSEIISMNSIPSGTYQIKVRGYRVPQGLAGRQPFAVIYTIN